MSQYVKVVDPDGEEWEVTRLNAHDLTEHVKGWSYAKTNNGEDDKPAQPKSVVGFDNDDEDDKEPLQEIIDNVGGKSEDSTPPQPVAKPAAKKSRRAVKKD